MIGHCKLGEKCFLTDSMKMEYCWLHSGKQNTHEEKWGK